MRKNKLSDSGAAALAAALPANTGLFALDLRANGIGEPGVAALTRALPANNTLCRLDLAGNNNDALARHAEVIDALLARNTRESVDRSTT